MIGGNNGEGLIILVGMVIVLIGAMIMLGGIKGKKKIEFHDFPRSGIIVFFLGVVIMAFGVLI